MRKVLLVLLSIVVFAGSAAAQEQKSVLATPAFNYEAFARLPVQHEGRVKPLDTFARVMLTGFYGQASLPDMSAPAWLAEMLFDQESAYQRPVFNIANPDVLTAIGLKYRPHHRYNFVEVSQALRQNAEMLDRLGALPEGERSGAQEQLLELYSKVFLYFEIARSLSLILPVLNVDDPVLAEKLNVEAGAKLNYLEMMEHRPAFLTLAEEAIAKNPDDMEETDQAALYLGHGLQRLAQDQRSRFLRLVPPQWDDSAAAGNGEWLAPWAVLADGGGSPQTAALFDDWAALAIAYRTGNEQHWDTTAQTLLKRTKDTAGKALNSTALATEYRYNQLDLFRYSLIAYIGAFVVLLAGGLGRPALMRRAAFTLLGGGMFLHAVGVCARMFIMARPPVATLYESILFVGLVTVIFAVILELRNRNNMGIMIGAVAGSLLQFIGMKYATDGDSMGMLQAVLDTNFWLATHVVTITIGYGCCFVAGVLGHLYLLVKVFHPADKERLNMLGRNMLGAGLVALFFAVLGTILGGIWADQSWGRFWGWDPKENGAMLIALWLIWLVHGRVAGTLRPLAFAMGMVLTNVVVALAWFGVNLLNVGLHSYGFTSHIAANLGLFCTLEILFVIGCALYIKGHRRGTTS